MTTKVKRPKKATRPKRVKVAETQAPATPDFSKIDTRPISLAEAFAATSMFALGIEPNFMSCLLRVRQNNLHEAWNSMGTAFSESVKAQQKFMPPLP